MLEKLIEDKRIELIGLGTEGDAFGYAKELMESFYSPYRQERLTPMDALIIADALIDNECSVIYTRDRSLLTDKFIHDHVNGLRAGMGSSYLPISFRELT